MKVEKSSKSVKTMEKGRPKCPRCGRNLAPEEIRTLRRGGVVVCRCKDPKERKGI